MTTSAFPDVMEKLVSLSKRRGFIFQSSEIYGGTGSVWDYGPLGVELKKNLKDRWWNAMVRMRDDIEGLDAAILMHPRVWEASGHVSGFVDPLVECSNCRKRFRADDARIKGTPGTPDVQCPSCGMKGTLGAPRLFNLMFKTFMGPVEDTASVVYLRPETAQGIYVNFLNVQQSTRQKIPFGIAQIGKAFRNEITPGNFIFRTREFEQMEMQFFVEPGSDMEWFEYWKAQRLEWHKSLGLDPARLRQSAVRCLTRFLRWLLEALRVLELVSAETAFTGLAIDQRVDEPADVATRLPDSGMHQNRGIDPLDVIALAHERRPPSLLKVALQLNAERAVVPHRSKSAVDLRRLEDKASSLA
jgi:hypothetical protein